MNYYEQIVQRYNATKSIEQAALDTYKLDDTIDTNLKTKILSDAGAPGRMMYAILYDANHHSISKENAQSREDQVRTSMLNQYQKLSLEPGDSSLMAASVMNALNNTIKMFQSGRVTESTPPVVVEPKPVSAPHIDYDLVSGRPRGPIAPPPYVPRGGFVGKEQQEAVTKRDEATRRMIENDPLRGRRSLPEDEVGVGKPAPADDKMYKLEHRLHELLKLAKKR